MKAYKTIVDVRTPAEFMGGHVQGSINIPLGEVSMRLDEIKQMQQPILLCCASGNRSGQAMQYLKAQGVACENGGGWMQVYANVQKAVS
ncbi:MAG: rhodanese-like domain-containing protein [Chitinophagales bacterium]